MRCHKLPPERKTALRRQLIVGDPAPLEKSDSLAGVESCEPDCTLHPGGSATSLLVRCRYLWEIFLHSYLFRFPPPFFFVLEVLLPTQLQMAFTLQQHASSVPRLVACSQSEGKIFRIFHLVYVVKDRLSGHQTEARCP